MVAFQREGPLAIHVIITFEAEVPYIRPQLHVTLWDDEYLPRASRIQIMVGTYCLKEIRGFPLGHGCPERYVRRGLNTMRCGTVLGSSSLLWNKMEGNLIHS